MFSATSAEGDWDLFLMRPDGSARRNITNTADFHEAAGRFAPGGQKMLYYRIPKASKVDNNTYGTFDLVIASADGSNPKVFGKDYPWASWGPKGETLSCLSKTGIQIVDISTKKIVRTLDRKGIFEQLFASPDGKWLCGTANGLGEHWTIARMDSTSGELNAVSDGSCYNCTPDWFPDSIRSCFRLNLRCCSMRGSASVGYAFQIYFDFSGYSDMAVGLGRMFGFVFAKNSDSPYLAESITISGAAGTSRFLLGCATTLRSFRGHSAGAATHLLQSNAYHVSGWTWHGAIWNFVIWGTYHGVLLAFSRNGKGKRHCMPGCLVGDGWALPLCWFCFPGCSFAHLRWAMHLLTWAACWGFHSLEGQLHSWLRKFTRLII